MNFARLSVALLLSLALFQSAAITAGAVEAASAILESLAPPEGAPSVPSKDVKGQRLESRMTGKNDSMGPGKPVETLTFTLYSREPRHPEMAAGMLTQPQELPQRVNFPLSYSESSSTYPSRADLSKIKKAFLAIKYSSTLVHAFTVFTFEKDGVRLGGQAVDDRLVVTLSTVENTLEEFLYVTWEIYPYADYIRVALSEGKDTILFYPYNMTRESVALMFANAITLADRKNANMQRFGLLDNNCIINSLEIPNSILPEGKKLRGCIPQLTARGLHMKGVLGKPVKLEGEELLAADFDKLFPKQ